MRKPGAFRRPLYFFHMDRDSAPNVKIAGDARWKTHPCGGAYAFVGRVPQWDKEKPVMAAGAGRRHAKKRRKENALFVGKRFLFANTRETRGGAAACAQEGVELVRRFGAGLRRRRRVRWPAECDNAPETLTAWRDESTAAALAVAVAGPRLCRWVRVSRQSLRV